MTPASYSIPAHVSGDTWGGIPSIVITINGSPPTNNVVSAKIQFRKSAGSSVVLTLSSDEADITIVDAVNWELRVEKKVVTLCAGTYLFDLQTIDADGDIKTFLKGSWEILEDITR